MVRDRFFPYKWKLSDQPYPAKGIPYHRSKVFSCFACGGGSTMGYKLAGFDVIGCNEIDNRMMKCYIENHHPKYSFCEDIRTFLKRDDLPNRLYHLDILDGSPPCSSFSSAGKRHKRWGDERVFKEGQAKQVLDTLFFDFIDLAEKLQPKIVVAENVKGLITGQASSYQTNYINKIHDHFNKAGYVSQHFLLDASKMGVPQKRERVFVIALRKDLVDLVPSKDSLLHKVPQLNLKFDQKPILFSEIFHDYCDHPVTGNRVPLMENIVYKKDRNLGQISRRINKTTTYFSHIIIYKNEVLPTIVSNDVNVIYEENRQINFDELCEGGTFPKDYNFLNQSVTTLIGMSVPPVMMAQIAYRIYKQWILKINE